VQPDDWVRGNPNAKVTIVEYSDFQCPACKKAEPGLQRIIAEYPDKVKFVYRHFPLINIHQTALLAAAASEAAGNQGKFWEMHNLLFASQENWAEKSNAREWMIALAHTAGLDVEKFQGDLDSQLANPKVANAFQGGVELGLNHTPTIFVNGEEATDTTYEGLRQLIEEKLRE
jgi:protein-disulfide isomerase